MNVNALTPAEVAQAMVEGGMAKHKQAIYIQFLKAVIAGVFLSFGGTLALTLGGGSPELNANNPGLVKVLSGFVFPIGLILIVLQGQELVTSNMMSMMMSTLKGKTPWYSWPLNIFVVFWGNLVGALFYTAILVRYSGILSAAPYVTYVRTFAMMKAVTPGWHQIFLRGIGCNWLVCLAVWQATGARETVSKIIAIHLPIWLFVACSFDHVVANMFFLPLAIMLFHENPPFSAGYYIWKSLIPSFIGNVVGAAFVALPFTLFYLTKVGNPDAGAVPEDIETGKGLRDGMMEGAPGTPNDSSSTHTHTAPVNHASQDAQKKQ